MNNEIGLLGFLKSEPHAVTFLIKGGPYN